MIGSPCPCRGCTIAYKKGIEDAKFLATEEGEEAE